MEVFDEKTGELVYKQRLPLNQVYSSVTLAGGYARRLKDTVAIHRATIEAARAALTEGSGRRLS